MLWCLHFCLFKNQRWSMSVNISMGLVKYHFGYRNNGLCIRLSFLKEKTTLHRESRFNCIIVSVNRFLKFYFFNFIETNSWSIWMSENYCYRGIYMKTKLTLWTKFLCMNSARTEKIIVINRFYCIIFRANGKQ